MLDALAATQAAFEELSSQSAESTSPVDESNQDSPEDTPSSSTTESSATDSSASPATQGESTQQSTAPTGPVDSSKPKGPLPYERHEAILSKARQEYDAKIAELNTKLGRFGTDYEAAAERAEAFAVAERDPAAFVNWLRNNPQFAPLLQPAQVQRQESAPVDENPMPKPDKLYDDGSTGYSPERLQELMKWNRREAIREVEQTYGPIKQQHEAAVTWNKTVERNRPVLENARSNWEGFKENENEIRAVLEDAIRKGDTSVTLHEAYRRTVVPKLKANEAELRNRIRQELIAESNRKSTAVTEVPGGQVTRPATDTKGMSIEDVVRSVYSELSGG